MNHFIKAITLSTLLIPGFATAAGKWDYPGGSGSDFITFVRAHGAGTYVITGQVEVTSTIRLDVENVTITSNTMSTDWLPTFKISAPGVGIEVVSNNVEFNRVSFVAANPASYSGVLVKTNHAQRTRYIDSTWRQGKGTAIYEDGSFATFIRGPHIEGLQDSGDGIGIYLTGHAAGTTIIGEGYGRGIFNGGVAVYMDDAEGVFIEKLMSYKTRQGLFMNPVADNSIINIVLHGVNFDTTSNYGNAVRSWNGHGNYKITHLFFENCWMYSSITGGPTYQFDTPIETVTILGGFARSDNPSYPNEFVFNSTVTNKVVQFVQTN